MDLTYSEGVATLGLIVFIVFGIKISQQLADIGNSDIAVQGIWDRLDTLITEVSLLQNSEHNPNEN